MIPRTILADKKEWLCCLISELCPWATRLGRLLCTAYLLNGVPYNSFSFFNC